MRQYVWQGSSTPLRHRCRVIVMRECGEPNRDKNCDDPDAEPWTALALLVLLALVCLILIARCARLVIAG